MKIFLLLLSLLTMCGCQQLRHDGAKSRTAPVAASVESAEAARETRQRSLHDITEARVRSYEKRGYSNAEARAVAEAEYFRSGK